MAHRGSNREWRGAGCRRRVPAAKLDAELEVRALQGVSGPAGPSVRFVVDLRMSYRVRGVRERLATGKLLGAQSLPELGLGAIPAV